MYVIKQLFSLTSPKNFFYQAMFFCNYNTSITITSLLIRIERSDRIYKFLKKIIKEPQPSDLRQLRALIHFLQSKSAILYFQLYLHKMRRRE